MTQQVTIAGGGVIGLCCAWYLQKKGLQVTVIERGDITNGTSFGNAGYISPSHIIPLASPGIIAKGLRWMLSSTSPFYIKPRLNADLIRWCLAFWRNANQSTMNRNIPPLFEILMLSRELSADMKEELGNTFRMEEKGIFMMYKNLATEKHELELAKEANALGLETIICNAQEVQQMEPDVEINVRGGVLYPIDAHLHPGDFMRTLHAALVQAGVTFHLNTNITGFEKQGNKINAVITDKGKFNCDELVLAPGSWLPTLTKQLGIHLLLQGGKGYSMTFENIERNLNYPAILVDHRTAMTPMGADLRMGGTMEISGLGSPTLVKRAQAIYNAAKLYYPDLPVQFPEISKIWHGYRPLSPDGLPYIGRHSRYNNLVIACGHAMLGLSLAAGTGKIVEEIVTGSTPSINYNAFNVERK